eukprot:8310267-Lingulodinium_polyedra.AAC.1
MAPYVAATGKGPGHVAALVRDHRVIRLGGPQLSQQPEVVLQDGHETAHGARVADVDALSKLRAPVSGLREHL